MKSVTAILKKKLLTTKITTFLNRSRFRESSSQTLLDPSFGLTEEDKALQQTALNFAIKELRPNSKKWDNEKYFPVLEMRKAAELGFGGLSIKEELGGSGLSRYQTSLVIEALAQGCLSSTAFMALHNLCGNLLANHANEKQLSKFLPDLISMKKIATYCLTEPDAGSDAVNLKTSASKKGDYYVLNGTKAFIIGAGESDYYYVICRTGKDGPKGISCIIVEKDTEGIFFGENDQKLGWNCLPTKTIYFKDCKVPSTNLISKEGTGFKIAMSSLNGGRINIASCSLGGAQFAIEETIKYVKERKQFNKSISDFQNTQFQLAKYSSELFCSRIALREVAKFFDQCLEGKENIDNVVPYIAATKFISTEKCFLIIDGCLQLFGGYGYLYDYPLQQILRDSRVNRIVEGTSEIMQLLISRSLLK